MTEAAPLDDLLNQFDEFLKTRLGMTGFEGARNARRRRTHRLEEMYRKVHAELGLGRLLDAARADVVLAEDDDLSILRDIIAFLESIIPASVEVLPEETAPTHEAAVEEAPPSPSIRRDLGRVSPTEQTPADPLRFAFWVRPGIEVSLGDILAADGQNAEGLPTVTVGVVHKLERKGLYRSPVDHYMAHDLGNPQAEMPTRLPFVLIGECGILWRSDGRDSPPADDWALRLATPEEVRRALSGGIPPDYAVPAGFVELPDGELVPVDMDLRWLAGYEGGHINVAGISGVAAKTSYGLFLLLGLLAANRSAEVQEQGGIAVIAFNVKEIDLLSVDQVDGWEEAPRELERHVRMWSHLRAAYGMDPRTLLQNVQYYAPGTPARLHTLRPEGTRPFSYGWSAMRRTENAPAFHALFDPDDLDDKMYSALEGVLHLNADTFDNLEALLGQALGRGSGEWITLETETRRNVVIHRATLAKLVNRLRLIREDMGGVLIPSSPEGEPLPLEALRPGQLWVIDITQVGDRARRYLFYLLLRRIGRLLQERKARRPQRDTFPGRVVVMVDELNRFAPAGGGRHPTRAEIVHIASQGRSYGLTLLGLQQMASRIEEEVLTNTGTFAVGRAHPSELSGPAYGWMGTKALREQAAGLPPGTMLVYHPLWRQPVFVRFPLPPHRLAYRAQQVAR